MPVESPHQEYTKQQHVWQKCRDAFLGEDAVKDHDVPAFGNQAVTALYQYLPMLGGQDAGEYNAYKMRATFYAATERTIKGLTGAVVAKAPAVVFPESKEEDLKTIGADDEGIDDIAQLILEEVLATGRVGIYLDAPDDAGEKPYIAVYYVENIINWRTGRFLGKNMLTMVVLREKYEEIDPKDEFLTTSKVRYRVLRLDTNSGDPSTFLFRAEVWEENQTTKVEGVEQDAYIKVKDIVPKMAGGKTLSEIPFVFITPYGVGDGVEKPPLLDLVNMNFAHYRQSADYEHGLHFTALPTAWVAGFDPKASKLTIGSQVAWVSENPEAKAGYLEFTGAGLLSIANALESKEQKMAVLGARLLEDQKNTAEAAATVSLRHSGERSILANIATAVSQGLTQMLQWTASWMGLSTESLGTDEGSTISYELNKEFDTVPMDPQKMSVLMLALQSGQISWDVWFYNLQKGNVYPDNWDENTEREKIAQGGPTSPPVPSGKPPMVGKLGPPGGGKPPGGGAPGQPGGGGNPAADKFDPVAAPGTADRGNGSQR